MVNEISTTAEMGEKKVLYVNISDFGSIAECNPWKSRDEVLIKYWCQNNRKQARDYFRKNNYVIFTEEKVEIAEEIIKVEKELQAEIKHVKNDIEANKIKEAFMEKIENAGKKDKLNTETIKTLQKNIVSKVNKSCGINTEKDILDKTEKKSGIKISARNQKMFYKNIFEDDNFIYRIGGKVDGISKDMIVEAKCRTKESNVRKNPYDLFQLMGYIFVTGKSKGKLVQKFRDRIWDSEIETENEWGIIILDERWENFLNLHLFTFFEELQSIPKDFGALNKPFLTVGNNTDLFPAADNGNLEDDIIKLLYSYVSFPQQQRKNRISPIKVERYLVDTSPSKKQIIDAVDGNVKEMLFSPSDTIARGKLESQVTIPDDIAKHNIDVLNSSLSSCGGDQENEALIDASINGENNTCSELHSTVNVNVDCKNALDLTEVENIPVTNLNEGSSSDKRVNDPSNSDSRKCVNESDDVILFDESYPELRVNRTSTIESFDDSLDEEKTNNGTENSTVLNTASSDKVENSNNVSDDGILFPDEQRQE